MGARAGCYWVLAGIAACGGVASHDRSAASGGSAGDAGTAGPSSAGSGAVAGRCDLTATPSSSSGPCEAIVNRFWHDPQTGLCVPVADNWCNGGDGLFDTLAACQASCGGGGAGWGDCAHDGDCADFELLGQCEPEDVATISGVNQAHVSDVSNDYQHGLPTICNGPAGGAGTWQFFLPVCRASLCTVIDVRTSQLSACQKDADCILRNGAACCPSCDSRDLLSVSRDAQLCDVPTDCYMCGGLPVPPFYEPACVAGHCQVTQTL